MIIEIKKISLDEVKNLSENKEFLVLQGTGGDLNDWVHGFEDIFVENNIVPKDFKFEEAYSFKNEKINNLMLSLNSKDIDIAKLAILRLQLRQIYGAMWLSDYVDNYLKVDEHIDI